MLIQDSCRSMYVYHSLARLQISLRQEDIYFISSLSQITWYVWVCTQSFNNYLVIYWYFGFIYFNVNVVIERRGDEENRNGGEREGERERRWEDVDIFWEVLFSIHKMRLTWLKLSHNKIVVSVCQILHGSLTSSSRWSLFPFFSVPHTHKHVLKLVNTILFLLH